MQRGHSSFGKQRTSFNQQHSKFRAKKSKEPELTSVEVVNYKSVNYPDLCFLNFLAADPQGTPKQKELLSDLKEFISHPTWKYLDKKFENTELREKKVNTDRTLEIINRQSERKVTDITKIIKYKSRDLKTFQLYIRQFGSKLSIFLIDLYHLGLPGDKYTVDGKVIPYNLKKIYNKNNTSNRTLCINTILNIEN